MGPPDSFDRAKIQEYRAKRLVALERSTAATDPRLRASWLIIAEFYYDIAERLARKT